MKHEQPQEQPKAEENLETLEHDAARLHREIEIIDAKTKAISVERAAKKKELEGVTRRLVTIRIKAMK
jgi:hypothetical protein